MKSSPPLLWWSSYKYRFVPWLALNLRSELAKQAARRAAAEEVRAAVGIGPEEDRKRLDKLAELCRNFQRPDPTLVFRKGPLRRRHFAELHRANRRHVLRHWGFSLEVRRSRLPEAGAGVFVSRGRVVRGDTAALYPGVVYEPGQPVLLQSIANQFVLRCSDGVMVDGNHRGISRIVFSSIHGRERAGSLPLCDPSWLERDKEGFTGPANPLSVGQIVNNATDQRTSNVAYHELDVPEDWDGSFGTDFRCHLPNISYESSPHLLGAKWRRVVRIVPLVATRDIEEGEELYSSYLSVVPS